MKPLKISAFASGRGSNLEAIIHKVHRPQVYARLVSVVGDCADAKALETARHEGIPTFLASYAAGKRVAEQAILSHLAEVKPDLLVLCGFMRLLSADFVRLFPERMINIHPSLLPAFPGLHAQKQALDYGVKIAGCTVHFVDAGMDTGKIILQAAVPVLESDTEETLSARILKEEHELLPKAIEYLAGLVETH